MYNRYGHSYYGRSGAGFFRAAATGRPITVKRGVGFLSPGEAAFNRGTGNPGDPLVHATPWFSAGENLPNFTETDVGARGRVTANSPYPPDEYGLQEIVVSGTRIPWWMWGIAGGVAFVALKHFARGR